VTFGQTSPGHPSCGNGGLGYCYVTSAAGQGRSTIKGNYWIVGAGNPTNGAGVDNGTQPAAPGVADFLPDEGAPNLYLKGDWTDGRVDGCVESVPLAQNAMAVGLSDVDGSAATGFFAAACVKRDPTVGVEYDFTTINPLTNIELKAIPKPTITGSTRVGEGSQVTIASPNFAPIFYSDGSPNCTIANVIPKYDVWVQQVPRGGAAPGDRNLPTAWVLGNTCNTGSPCQVTVNCGGGPGSNCDAFFAVSPKFDVGGVGGAPGGFGSQRVSPNSTRTQAGQTLATPPKPKTIRKVDAGVRPQ
jgi:hypothetical protein